MASPIAHVVQILHDFQDTTRKLHNFVTPQLDIKETFCELTKYLYDESSLGVQGTASSNFLSKLITRNFDDEQIWQQLELNNNCSIPTLLEDVTKTVVKKKADSGLENVCGIHATDDEEDEALSEAAGDVSSSDSEISFKKLTEEEDIPKPKVVKRKQKSEVDDRFFNLSQLEKFLAREDAREEKEQNQGSSDDDNDDRSTDVDYFDDIPSDLSEASEDNNETVTKKSAREACYADFFDPPSENEVDEEKEVHSDAGSDIKDEDDDDDAQLSDMEYDTRDVDNDKPPTAGELWESRPRDLLPASDSDKSDNSSSENEEGTDEKTELGKSNFQKQQDKLKEKILLLEQDNLTEKPWQLKGEVTADKRPENSLLEEHLQFEHLVRQAPVITEETTKTLEEIILQRIKDKAWDDVERKVKPKEVPFEYKRRVTLDQEKSKMSLAEIYEKEYIKKQQNEKEEKPIPEHSKIKKAMDDLFYKLDSLSNFHYTPKSFSSEIKLVNNLPAISAEDVAPVSVSDAGLLAPEEVKDKLRTEYKGQTERSLTDRKRERRAKKLFQKRRKEAKEAKMGCLKPSLQTKQSREEAKKNKKKDSPGDKKVKDSSSFFEKLQEKVHAEVHSNAKKKKPVADKKATKYKL